jgi:hypothetical protein
VLRGLAGIEIVAALEEHRPDQACAWATVHIAGVEEWVGLAADLG